MDWLVHLMQFILHFDQYLVKFVAEYGAWTYGVLFAIIFCETGLIVTPILPGDSLLFAAGSLAAKGALDPHLLFILLAVAAILGDAVNFSVGYLTGHKLFANPNSRLFKREYFDKTHAFYETHGGKTIVIARFMPIIRTFAPFVAGVAEMRYTSFAFYNISGALLWVGLFIYSSFYFGNLPWVKNNFSVVILVIIILSVLPAVIEILRQRFRTT